MIKLQHISKSFDNNKTFVVRDVSLEVPKGKTVILLGTSGCGKSTTLKMVNRLIEPTSGTIEMDEQNILFMDKIELRRSIGYVFQEVGLFPHMTISENISIVLQLINTSKIRCKQRAHELLEMVNLNPSIFANRYPEELSGGQQQRVGVARALAHDPKCLLMDEPFGALDPINRKTLQDELASLKDKLNKTILFVTHDIFEAVRLGDYIAVMNKGRIEQMGMSKDLIQDPATPFVAELFQHSVVQMDDFNKNALDL